MKAKRNLRLTVLLTAIVLLTVSCADDSTLPGTAAGPEFVELQGQEPLNSSMCGGGGRRTASTVAVVISQAVGGTVSADRATVVIPAGALYADAVISVTPETGRFVGATLGPHGTVFAKPVTLQFDLKGTGYLPTDDLTIYWFNEKSGAWEDIGGTLDPATMTLSTQLEHFSDYRAGRAGW